MSYVSFDLEVRVGDSTEDDVKKFLEDFNSSSGCTFNILSWRRDKRQVGGKAKSKLRGFRKCCLNVASSEKKAKQEGKDINCEATINFRLENPTINPQSSRGEDKVEYPLWVRIHYHHNHATRCAEHLKFLSVSSKIRHWWQKCFKMMGGRERERGLLAVI